ncbi:MAG TPA: nickel-dependent hydrogenase large subunit, partial [Armatimonadetes bacterium]|nr:nickel-dependent hydrogenase large subunit [Armatimonadota bacterium]
MARKIVLDPITRIEGHLKIEVSLDGDNTVEEAISSGTLFRGIEIILKGRDPRDALRITQRICGVCPTAHSTASALCLDSAFGIADKIPDNGRIIRNLILGSNYLHNHILHFYHLSALDYLDITRAERYDDPELQRLKEFIRRGELAPFLPRLEGDYRLSDEDNRALLLNYIRALDIRRKAHEMLSIFGGKMPHNMGIVAGGATSSPTTEKIASFLWRLNEIRDFIENSYLPDVIRVAKAYQDHFEIGGGWGNFLSFGVFDLDGSEPDYTK